MAKSASFVVDISASYNVCEYYEVLIDWHYVCSAGDR